MKAINTVILLSVGIFCFAVACKQPPPEIAVVLVAKTDLPARAVLKEDLVEGLYMPRKYMQRDAYEVIDTSGLKRINGLVALINIPKGDQITLSAVGTYEAALKIKVLKMGTGGANNARDAGDPKEIVPVLAAKYDLPARTVLREDMVKIIQMPRMYKQHDAHEIRNPPDIKFVNGAITVIRISKGNQIPMSAIRDPGEILDAATR